MDICQVGKPSKWFGEVCVHHADAIQFKSVAHDSVSDLMAEYSSQLVVVANDVMKVAGGDEDES